MTTSPIRPFVLLMICLAATCAGGSDAQIRNIKDLSGRKVALPRKVERLIALGPGALRFVVYLGAVNTVVGIEEMEKRMVKDPYVRPYAHILDEAFFRLPVVGPGGPGKLPDFESVLLCRPDAIITVTMDTAQANNLQSKTGVPVVCLSYGELGAWRKEAQQSLTLLADILGREQRAKELNAYIARLQRELYDRTGALGANDLRAAYFGGISFKGAHGLTSTESGYPPAEMVKAVNLANGLGKQGHLFVDREQILVWNPDVIFVDIGSKTILERDFNEHRDFYRLLKATRNRKVFSLLPYNYYNTNIELALLNACFIGKCLYPDQFKDLDIRAKAREIFGEFLGTRVDASITAYSSITFPEQGPVQWRQQ
jgi:iron complex transport system substrate-binding protein